MRDTRAAPSQTLDQKTAAMGRKGLNNLQSFRGVEVLDPLGLGYCVNSSENVAFLLILNHFVGCQYHIE